MKFKIPKRLKGACHTVTTIKYILISFAAQVRFV